METARERTHRTLPRRNSLSAASIALLVTAWTTVASAEDPPAETTAKTAADTANAAADAAKAAAETAKTAAETAKTVADGPKTAADAAKAAADSANAAADAAKTAAKAAKAAADAALAAADAAKDEVHGVDAYLKARCASALCFYKGNWLGIEPLVELPVGKSFAIGAGSLVNYVNNHEIKVDLAAGFRIWFFRDLISVSLYLSFPLSSSDVKLEGSSFTYPASAIRRPFPGLAFGLLYDIIWVGIDHDELRNGDTVNSSGYNPEFPTNARISSCTTITVALQVVTATRALFGAVATKKSKAP
jgi:hypothetical protein